MTKVPGTTRLRFVAVTAAIAVSFALGRAWQARLDAERMGARTRDPEPGAESSGPNETQANGAAISAPNASARDAGMASHRAPSAADLALVAPLAVGVPLGAWRVKAVSGIEDGMTHVTLTRAPDDELDLGIALDGHDGPEAPATVGPYAVFYVASTVSAEDAQRAALALAAIVKTHLDLPVSPELRPFRPQPRPHVNL